MDPEENEALQARIDELMLLEERCERRIQDFMQSCQSYQEKDKKINRDISESLFGIQEAAQQLQVDLNRTIDYRRWTGFFCCAALIIGIVILLGSYFWSQYIISQTASTEAKLSKAQAKLIHLKSQLKRTPQIEPYNGKYYVRVNPESGIIPLQRMYTREPMGSFAEMWTSD